MPITKQLILTSLCFACAAPISAQQGNGGDDYAGTANSVTLAKPVALTIDPGGMTVLSPNLGKLSAGIQPVMKNYMILWCAAEQGPSQVEWTVDAPADDWAEYADLKAEIQFAAIDGMGAASSARPLSDIDESGDV